MRTITFALIALSLATPAIAQSGKLITKSDLFGVKVVKDASGKTSNKLVIPKAMTPGMPLVLVFNYKNETGQTISNFVATNPVDKSVRFTGFEDASAWGQVSVDGGKTFGPLVSLKVRKPDGTMRPAQNDDVTTVRWAFAKPMAPGAKGTLIFYGAVK